MTSNSPLWRHGDFLRLWAAQTVSDFGARITREGLPMMAVMALAATPSQLGLLYALSSGPALLVGLTAGDLVDHTARRPILIAADLVRGAILIALPATAWLGWLAMWQVYVAAASVAAASVLFDIADHAYLPGLVGKPLITDANAKLSATESVAEMGGPALAGVLFQWLTAPIAVAVNAATYLLSALLLARIRVPEPPPAAGARRRGWVDGVVTGAKTAWAEPRVRTLLIMTGTGGLFGGFFGALYIAFVLRGLGLGPILLGLGIATGGVGALAGSVLVQPIARWVGVGPAICLAGALSALGTMIVLLAPANPVGGMAALVVSQFLGDAFGVVPLVLAISLRQSVLPLNVLGRVGATFRALGGGAAVAGALAGGALAQSLGLRQTLLLAIGGLLLGPLIGALSPLRQVKEMPVGS
ncbi:MFS transporter [Phenylobacterium sp.]|jgi:MFS family permease|uniref:MFS transporter n=1 Tax=Phenylobacterium sp. TaxID=1871053 RepID=UPI002E337049|nr:MFS transporter [Phenylobacterium sp.]HEX4708876.1 MFS transporter [Phenylobacterium sp.]